MKSSQRTVILSFWFKNYAPVLLLFYLYFPILLLFFGWKSIFSNFILPKNSIRFFTNFIVTQDGAVGHRSRHLAYLMATSIFFEQQKRQKTLSNVSGIQVENVSIYLTTMI